ncbi:hypothetical protein E2320_001266 [Naja naja]|nr:hypothetical protein E2320_001266 [Naja naja]
MRVLFVSNHPLRSTHKTREAEKVSSPGPRSRRESLILSLSLYPLGENTPQSSERMRGQSPRLPEGGAKSAGQSACAGRRAASGACSLACSALPPRRLIHSRRGLRGRAPPSGMGRDAAGTAAIVISRDRTRQNAEGTGARFLDSIQRKGGYARYDRIVCIVESPKEQQDVPLTVVPNRLREVEHHPLLAENDCYDSSSSACDAGDRLWFIRDSCGMVCAVMTWLLVVYADFVVTFVMLLPSKDFWYSLVNGVLFNGLAVLALSSHLRTMLMDPGAVPKGNATKEYMESLQLKPGEVIYKCPKCCSVKPERAHHCSICKRCIRKMDHHCPWVNNCVGERNQRFFVLFTMYIALISAHALILCGFQFFSCIRDHNFSPPVTVILLIFLCLEGFLFLTFTAVMFGTQIHSICNDETEIERLKSEKPTWERRLCWEGMKSVFGGQPSLLWINPFAGFRIRRLLLRRAKKGAPEFSV